MATQSGGAKVAREGAIRGKLPADILAIVEATATDPGVPFEPDALARIREVRAADLAAWARFREAMKGAVPLAELDRLTAPAGGEGDGKQGRPVEWDDPEPWPDPVDGAELADGIMQHVEHYTSLPGGGSVAVILWALYTWVFDSFGVSPNLMITAPERESGKTRVTELLSWIVRRAKPVSDASAAAIIRGIERDRPTLLLDEAQSFLRRKGDDPIRGILLASFVRRFASVERVERDKHDGFEVREFSTFTPKAMNGRNLARVDDMLTSRSIVLAMTRAPGQLPELRHDRDPVGVELRQRCARWAADHKAELREADPDMGERIGRTAQVWRPLFAIADALGGAWPMLARKAADLLDASAAKVSDGGATLGLMLLADVREVFGDREEIQSADLDRLLNALPERPWATIGPGGKAMTAQKRGQLIADYGIQTLEVKGRRKGYKRAQFEEAWTSYLPQDTPESNRGTVESLQNKAFPETPNRGNGASLHGSVHAGNPTDKEVSTVPRFNIPGERENGTQPAPDVPKQPPDSATLGDAYRRARDGE